ncbi:MAG: Asp23/Gls24 family envelope stress response protein [Solirubrobacteraceae bacterium]
MAVIGANGSGRLPCGTPLEVLVEQVLDGAPNARSGHQASCPHCRGMLGDLADVEERLRELAAEDVEVPAGLVPSVMRAVGEHAAAAREALMTPPGMLRPIRPILLSEGRGATWVADRIVARVAQRVAEAIPGVHLLPRARGVTVSVGERGVIIAVGMIVEYDRAVAGVTDAVRVAVIDAVETEVGLPVFAVNVHVRGVHSNRR